MKVILLQDVKGKGRKGDIINVSDGYGKNYLIQQKLAEIANEINVKKLYQWKEQLAVKNYILLTQMQQLKAKLEAITLDFKLQFNKGKPFGSISSKQIEEKLVKEYQIQIDKKKFVKHDNLTQVGLHKLQLKLHQNVTAILNVNIVVNEGK